MTIRPLLAAVVVSLPWATTALAQTAPAPEASLSHSALKATTFKAGTVITNLTVLSYATGGLVGGMALTTFMTAASWLIYTANDYIWDSYSPPLTRQDSQPFDAGADVWRNTGKYLTYKPVIASIKLASLYVYTSSAAITAVFGTASVLTNTAVFYANNMAWDWYDWYSGAPAATAGGRP
jgi:uncharacterized membrane protein